MPDERIVISCDVSSIDADEIALDALARLQLMARRMGVSIELRNARPQLVDLLTFLGLAGLLAVEAHRQAEQREEVGIDEEVDPGDASV